VLQSIAGDLASGLTHVMAIVAALAIAAAACAALFPHVAAEDKR
jgi:hypothetical protein